MSGGPVRRIVLVLVAYALFSIGVLRASAWIRRTFALPPLFDTLLLGLLGVGVVLAVVLAVRYPDVGAAGWGASGEPVDRERPRPRP